MGLFAFFHIQVETFLMDFEFILLCITSITSGLAHLQYVTLYTVYQSLYTILRQPVPHFNQESAKIS